MGGDSELPEHAKNEAEAACAAAARFVAVQTAAAQAVAADEPEDMLLLTPLRQQAAQGWSKSSTLLVQAPDMLQALPGGLRAPTAAVQWLMYLSGWP